MYCHDSFDSKEFLPTLFVLFKNNANSMLEGLPETSAESDSNSQLLHCSNCPTLYIHNALVQMKRVISTALHDIPVMPSHIMLDNELGFWMLPRWTAWF